MSSYDPQGAQAPPPQPGADQNNDQRLVVVLLVLALLVVIAAFAAYVVTDDDEPSAVSTTETTSAATPSSSGGSSGTTESTPEAPANAPCTGDALLAATGGEIDGIAITITGSTCTATSGGYAIATVEPADPTVIADPLTVYFEDTGGTWAVLDFGTGLSCADAGIPADACADL